MTTLLLNPNNIDDYRMFLRIKSLPRYRITGRVAEFPDEYAATLGIEQTKVATGEYQPRPFLFDYQRAIASLAIRKRKFAAFMACGMGKTAVLLEFARHCSQVLPSHQSVLIVSPLMVIRQTVAEAKRFYGDDMHLQIVRAANLDKFLANGHARIGITNYESIRNKVDRGTLGALILDESSMLKSHYGKWGQRLIELGRGLNYKLCLTGTPAPNDRIEYANHAVFLDQSPNVNSFLARFFVNRGQTDNRWELKPHALRPFYTALSHWCIFMESPATYGWKDNAGTLPPIHVHIEDVPLTAAQKRLVHKAGGDMYGTPGGITSRAKLSQLAKGRFKGKQVESNKAGFIRDLIASWPDESTLVWCLYNREQESVSEALPGCGSMYGDTPEADRMRMIEAFKSGELRTLVSKAKVLGFGLNLQRATRQVFSGLVDSYESYHQCVKRSNRIGSDRPLNVHIPVTPIEWPMVDTVLRKAKMVQQDTEEQETIFKECCYEF